MQIPAQCDTCGSLFSSGIEMGPGVGGAKFTSSRSGPCPVCHSRGVHSWGHVVDGVYDTLGGSLNILVNSPDAAARVQGMIDLLETARSQGIAGPELIGRMQEIAPGMTETSAFWSALTSARGEALMVLLALLLTVLGLMQAQMLASAGDSVSPADVEEIITRVVKEVQVAPAQQPATPPVTAPPPAAPHPENPPGQQPDHTAERRAQAKRTAERRRRNKQARQSRKRNR